MEKSDTKNYLKLINETKGQAIKKIPDSEKTSLICRLAVEYDKGLLEHVPNKYLPEVVKGKEFVAELDRRAQQIIRNEADLLFVLCGRSEDLLEEKEKYINERLKEFTKKFEEEITRISNINTKEGNNIQMIKKRQ